LAACELVRTDVRGGRITDITIKINRDTRDGRTTAFQEGGDRRKPASPPFVLVKFTNSEIETASRGATRVW
jgi:hypothetical protein